MNVSELTTTHLADIIQMYIRNCGTPSSNPGEKSFHERMFGSLDTLVENLKAGEFESYRVGSRWDGHSKVAFSKSFRGHLLVDFNPNFDPHFRSGPEYEECVAAGEKFEQDVRAYLKTPESEKD